MANPKRLKNNLGILGWGIKGRWGFERYLYILHRITGLGILSYFLLHIIVTTMRVYGPDKWNSAMSAVDHLPFKIGEFLVYLAFAFHGLNGIRLILIELGFKTAVGEPEEPVYPYETSLNRQRPLMVVCMILAAALVAVGGWNFLHVLHIF